MGNSHANVGSSVTIIKGSLVAESYTAFEHWDVYADKRTNLKRLKELNTIGARTEDWLRTVASMIGRRFESEGRDRPLIEPAIRGHERELWRPLLESDLRAAGLEEVTNWTDCPSIGFGEVSVAAAMTCRACVRRNNKMVEDRWLSVDEIALYLGGQAQAVARLRGRAAVEVQTRRNR